MVFVVSTAVVGWAQDQVELTGPQPQVVRVSYVEGDVRVSRGKDNEKLTHAEWERAAVDLPLESGYSLVTGSGRAEIEFEDASTAYLAENSVLVFNDLHTSNGIPQTELALLSGTMSVFAQPTAAGERFIVRTPTDRFTVLYPNRSFVRINSFLDGVTITGMGGTPIRMLGGTTPEPLAGTTVSYKNGTRIVPEKPLDQAAYADFDAWATRKATVRAEAMQATMKDAGLKQPIPGLADLNGKGHFYACPPYGMCWEPTNGFAGQATDAEKAAMARQTVSVAALAKGGPKQAGQSAVSSTQSLMQYATYFPCSPSAYNSVYRIDPATGRRLGYNGQLFPVSYGFGSPLDDLNYLWTVCHSGSWIRHEGRYAWVPGKQRHSHCPVHWVKSGHSVGYVPVHPGDRPGKPPVGLKDGIVQPVDKQGTKVQLVAASGSAPVKLLESPPKGFQRSEFVPLQKADAPRVQAFALRDAGVGAGSHGSDVTFDHKSQSFMVAQSAMNGGAANSKMMAPIGGRGSDLQVHAGSGGSEAMRGSSNGYSGNTSRGSSPVGNSSSYSGGGSHSSAPPVSAPPPPPSAPAPMPAAPAASSGGAAGKR
jgi:hypothetical protein